MECKPKSLNDFLAEDPILKRKVTYNESKLAGNNTDVSIAEAYNSYCQFVYGYSVKDIQGGQH